MTCDKGGFETVHSEVRKFQELSESLILLESVELLVLLPNTEDAMVGLSFLCWRTEVAVDVEREGGSGR